MPTTTEINAAADAYVLAVYGADVVADPDYSMDVTECRKDYKEGIKWALGMAANIVPRPPKPNGPPKS